MGGPSRVIQKQLSLGPMLHARRCASADGYSLGSSAGSSTIPACKDHSAVGVTCPLLVAAVSSSPRVPAASRLPPLDRARSGHAAAVFKTGAVLSISRHISCANGRHLLPHLAVIPRIFRGLRMLAVLDARIAC